MTAHVDFRRPALSETGTLPTGVTFDGSDRRAGRNASGTERKLPDHVHCTQWRRHGRDAELHADGESSGGDYQREQHNIYGGHPQGRSTLTATGSPAPALSETGTLPAGVTFNSRDRDPGWNASGGERQEVSPSRSLRTTAWARTPRRLSRSR